MAVVKYYLGTPSNKYTPTVEITKFVQDISGSGKISAPSDFKLTIINPNGIFSDPTRADYISCGYDYVVLITVDGLNVLRGYIVEMGPADDESGQLSTWTLKTDGGLMERSMVTGSYSPIDWAYVEDVIADLFKKANPLPKERYKLEYRIQDGFWDDFDTYDDGVTPTEWVEDDANGSFVVVKRGYNGTDPLYLSEPNSVKLKATGGNTHAVKRPLLYLTGDYIVVSQRIYIPSAVGEHTLWLTARSDDYTELAQVKFAKVGGNTTIYIKDSATSYAVWGPASLTSQWIMVRFIINLTTDTYAVYIGNPSTGAPVRYGMNAGYSAGGAWSATYNNDFHLAATGKTAIDEVRYYLSAVSADRELWFDDIFAYQNTIPLKTPLTREYRFSATSLLSAVTKLCAGYNLEWRDYPALRNNIALVRTFAPNTNNTSILTLATGVNLTAAQATKSTSQYKNFFIVRGAEDVVGYAADMEGIKANGFFPMETQDSNLLTGMDCDEAAEALRTQYARVSVVGTVNVNGDVIGYMPLLVLRPGDVVTVTDKSAGLGSATKYVVGGVDFKLTEGLEGTISLSDIWKSAAILAWEALQAKKEADQEELTDLVHVRYVAAKASLTGSWAFAGTTATAPAAGSASGITAFGKKAVREQQVVDDLIDTYVSHYAQRAKKFRLLDSQGTTCGMVPLDKWTIGTIGTDGSGNKYCTIVFENNTAFSVPSYFTWGRVELVAKRQYLLTEGLGTTDSRLELDDTTGLVIGDTIVITNEVGTTVTVTVSEVMSNKVQIYGTHAAVMPRGCIAEAYTSVIAGYSFTPVTKAAADTVKVQMTVKFTNEERASATADVAGQGMVTEAGLRRLCQRLRSPGTEKTMNANCTTTIIYTNDTGNINVGDYLELRDVSDATNTDLVTVASIVTNTSITINETLTAAEYISGDKIIVVCLPWSYISYGPDDAFHASNYYNSKTSLDREYTRVPVSGTAPLASDNVRLELSVAGATFPPNYANTVLDGAAAGVTQLKVKSTKGMKANHKLFIGSSMPLDLRSIVSVDSPTQVTVDSAVTKADLTPVCTGLRMDTEEIGVICDIGITDRPTDTGESSVQYYLGRFLQGGQKLDYGFGSEQFDEYTNKDASNNEYNKLNSGTAAVPTYFGSDEFATADYVSGVIGIGSATRPLTRVWRTRIRSNPLTNQKGRSPALQEVIAMGLPLSTAEVIDIDKSSASSYTTGSSMEQTYSAAKEQLKDVHLKFPFRWYTNRAKDKILSPMRETYSKTDTYKGMLFEFDCSGLLNMAYLHPDHLTLSVYGHGSSWDGSDWKSGIYAFVWLTGANEHYHGSVPIDLQDKDTLPHWEQITLLDTASADENSTTMTPKLMMGTFGGGNIVEGIGNRINQALVDDHIYVLIIPRNPDKLDRSSYVEIDYLTLGVDTCPIGEDSRLRTFRPGIDYYWSRDWKTVLWPSGTPTNIATTLSADLYAGVRFAQVTKDSMFSIGQQIMIDNFTYTIVNMTFDGILTIAPPAVKTHTSGASVYNTYQDRGLNVWVDNKYYHGMHPVPATALYTIAGQGMCVSISSTTSATYTVPSTEGFVVNADVIVFNRYTNEYLYTTVQSLGEATTITTVDTPGFVPTNIATRAITFTVNSEQFASAAQIVSRFRSMNFNHEQYSTSDTWRVVRGGNEEANLPSLVIDDVDETNGKIYLGRLMDDVLKFKTTLDDTVSSVGSERISIVLTTGSLQQGIYNNGICGIVDAGGVMHFARIASNYTNVIVFTEPFPVAIVAGQNVHLVKPGQTCRNGYTGFWCTNSSSEAQYFAWYNMRLFVTAAAAASPIVTDGIQFGGGTGESITTTSDRIRPTRMSKFFIVVGAASAKKILVKAGRVTDETHYAIDNTNLMYEENECAIAKQIAFDINTKYGPSWSTDPATTGRQRQAVDIINCETFDGTTTTTAKCYIGDTSITVTSSATFDVDDIILIDSGGTTGREMAQVASKPDGTHITVYSALRREHASGVTIAECYAQKVVLDTYNPYLGLAKGPVTGVVPFHYGAFYKVQYAVARGLVLARCLLHKSLLASPVYMKNTETLKAGIELTFLFDSG